MYALNGNIIWHVYKLWIVVLRMAYFQIIRVIWGNAIFEWSYCILLEIVAKVNKINIVITIIFASYFMREPT